MSFFEKKILIYQKKDKETWNKIKEVLKKENVKHVRSGHYFNESVGIDGISGMIDPRDFGVGHRIDRNIYYIEVKEKDFEKANEAILKHGIVAIVESFTN